ncbi:hypothetical protein G7046_g5533 [Stylonectria norvegica]|nr:hypothetical protein G7046_g5533 [Stylonectria norvegica]
MSASSLSAGQQTLGNNVHRYAQLGNAATLEPVMMAPENATTAISNQAGWVIRPEQVTRPRQGYGSVLSIVFHYGSWATVRLNVKEAGAKGRATWPHRISSIQDSRESETQGGSRVNRACAWGGPGFVTSKATGARAALQGRDAM